MSLPLPDPQLPSDPQDALQSIQRNFEALALEAGSGTTQPAMPVGAIAPFIGAAAPTGYLLCEGQAVSRTEYAALFAVCGTTYGAGNGSTTFNVPNLKGRIPMGAGTGAQDGGAGSGAISGGTALATRARGEYGGEEGHALQTAGLPAHKHGVNIQSGVAGAHFHELNVAYAQASNTATGGTGNRTSIEGTGNTKTYNTEPVINHSHPVIGDTANTGDGAKHNNVQPFLVVNYILKH